MKKRNIATLVRTKLVATVPGQLQRSRSISTRARHGECWPQSGGQEKTIIWQSPGWPASGKDISRAVQRSFSRFLKF